MKKLIYPALLLLAIGYGCRKKEKDTNKTPVYSVVSIAKPAENDTVYQTNDSSIIEFNVTDAVGIDTVFMNVLNPSGGSMYFGYFIVNDKSLHYKGYHKLNDGVTKPTIYTLEVDAHNSSKNKTVLRRPFVLAP